MEKDLLIWKAEGTRNQSVTGSEVVIMDSGTRLGRRMVGREGSCRTLLEIPWSGPAKSRQLLTSQCR